MYQDSIFVPGVPEGEKNGDACQWYCGGQNLTPILLLIFKIFVPPTKLFDRQLKVCTYLLDNAAAAQLSKDDRG